MVETPNQKLRANARGTELVWEGKYDDKGNLRPIERIALPFQVIETINQSWATREREPLFAGLPPPPLFETMVEQPSWRNKLIWGDNKYVLASLIEEFAGKINLIYIDPPFDTGDDFSFRVRVGDEEVAKQPSIIEQKAYNDTWGRGTDSYLQMMFERLVLIRDLLADNGSIYVHLDWHVGHYVKLLMDEVFGERNFRNEIARQRIFSHSDPQQFGRNHDVILFYAKTDKYQWNPQYQSYDDSYIDSAFRSVEPETGRRYQLVSLNAAGSGPPKFFCGKLRVPPPGRHWAGVFGKTIEELEKEGRIVISKNDVPRVKYYLDEMTGKVCQSLWTDVFDPQSQAAENIHFPTQKPEALLDRIIKASSNVSDLVADFFCGSGTTLAVAEKLGRRWIGCDLGRFAIHTTRKRLLDIPDCQPFEILNLGKYERRYWQVNVINGGKKGEKEILKYLAFIVELYHAQPVVGFSHLHGRKGGRMVHVGASDAPVTRSEIAEALKECSANRFNALDVLGWEWEMGLHDVYELDAKREGVDLRLLQIPREVMDRRAVEAGDVNFYELAHLETEVAIDGRTARVRLKNFFIPNPELVPDDLRDKVKKWSDWIDYWAVDWDFKEDTFHNQWQSYRTRRHPSLVTESDPYTYQNPGSYKVLVKVVDIFGNDTTKLVEVEV